MRELAMSTSVGGIGPLLKERVIAQGDLGADVTGISFLYDNVWVQKVKEGGEMVLEPTPIGDRLRSVLEYTGELSIHLYDGKDVTVKVWKAPDGTYGKGTVYFLDMPEIDGTLRARADVVYPGAAAQT
jgi:hypothetical protein